MADAVVSAASMRIVKILVGNPARTVADLIKVAGVTRTAVTEQLHELVGAGFVERTTERLPGRGRPRHLYAATNTALLLLFADNQRLVVPAIWRAIEKIGGTKLTQQVLKQVSRSLAEHYSRKITAAHPEKRLRQLIDLLREEGGLIDVEDNRDQLILRKRSCPFISMFDASRAVCTVDQEMMSAVVGKPVRRIQCRHDGDPCCAFAIDSGNHKK
jgi:predicted ArsR family transcriptional regulator